MSITIQPETQADGKMPYPFHITADGVVMRQDFWKGKPRNLIGFNGAPKNKTVEPTIGLEDFLKEPEKCIGLYPIFEHENGEWYTYKFPIESIRKNEND